MPSKYSGNVVRTYAHPDDAAPASVFKPDAAHGDTGATDATDPYSVRHKVPADTGAAFAGTDFPVDMAIGGGVMLDTPTWENHDGPVVAYPVYTDDQMREAIAPAHAGQDRGFRRKYAIPTLQAHTEVYGEQLVEGFTNQPVNTAALTRGINSYPANNPDREGYVNGYRPGLWRQLVAYRDRFQHRRRFEYDIQMLGERGDTVGLTVDRPALDGTPYYGPFMDGWLPPGLFHRDTQPRMYQAAETVDASLLATPAGTESSVIGGDVL